MYLTQLLHRNLQRRPNGEALVCGSTRRTYAQLHDRVARLACHLKRIGVQRGDRVAVLSLNSVECAEIMLAAWWMGAIFCPVNTRWSASEIAASFDDCTPEVLFVDSAHATLAEAASERLACLRHVVRIAPDSEVHAGAGSYPALLETATAVEDERIAGDHVAALVYTGGTTGRSKGVMLTHQTLWAASMARLADAGSLSDSVTMVATPIFHVAGVVRLVPHLTAGGCCIILPQFKAEDAIDLIEREGITEVAIVPSMLQMMLDHPDFTPQRLRSVKRMHYGAAPSVGALLQRAARTLPWVGFYQAYGMTESMGVGTVSFPSDHRPEDWVSGRALSAGQACTVTELRVVDAHGNDAPMGEVGEIVLRGPNVSPGYWNRPEETAQTFRGGWLHTGDAGRLDAHGYLYVIDRIKDMIVTGGENVYSAEVENALAQHPAVATSAVIGIPSDAWGEAVHAVVVLRAGAAADEAALKAHCRTLVAHYKAPKSVEFVAALPLTAAGKVGKNVPREKYWKGFERRVN